jgi:anionic cell wall polymer biosynthesis LytR-Cps2A-Psr (LCP) family protein
MMDMELKHKLEELETVTQENNEMLHSMHRAAVLHRILTIVKWVLIVIFAMAGYYVLQPFVESARKTYEAIQGGVTEVNQTKDSFAEVLSAVLSARKDAVSDTSSTVAE